MRKNEKAEKSQLPKSFWLILAATVGLVVFALLDGVRILELSFNLFGLRGFLENAVWVFGSYWQFTAMRIGVTTLAILMLLSLVSLLASLVILFIKRESSKVQTVFTYIGFGLPAFVSAVLIFVVASLGDRIYVELASPPLFMLILSIIALMFFIDRPNAEPKRQDVRKLCVLAMLSALAFIAAVFVRVPVVLFLRYDPKDIIITLGGFLYGPMAAFLITVVVSFVQMLTVSATGFGGFVMNVIAGSAFACTAAFVYKKMRNRKGAAIGLTIAWLFTTAVMLLVNYLIAPLVMGQPREEVVRLIIPAFLPFNLIKGGINAVITMLIYKPVEKMHSLMDKN